MANKNPTYKLKPKYEEALADIPVSVRLEKELDAYVRSLPNKTEWLRQVITEAYERDMQVQQENCA